MNKTAQATTAKELVSFFYEGQLGNLLESTFNGSIGYVNPGHQDSEVFISFPSDAETPDADVIKQVITDTLEAVGFIVKDMTSGNNNFHAQVLSTETDQVWVLITISTKYPSKGTFSHLRMNCHVSG
jgi:hypothetical protein